MSEFFLMSPSTPAEMEDYYNLRYEVLRKPWNRPRGSEQDETEADSFHLAVIDSSGSMYACGRLQLVSDTEAHIRSMAVKDGYRTKGLGKMIMSGLEEEAKRRGVKRISLQGREGALGFYLNNGYRNEGKTFILFDVIQHYLMVKDLDQD